MELWNIWYDLVKNFKSACGRTRTFHWLVVILIGFSVKSDFLGVTSLARGVGLLPNYYTCMLNFFNSFAVDVDKLLSVWINVVFERFTGLVKLNLWVYLFNGF